MVALGIGVPSLPRPGATAPQLFMRLADYPKLKNHVLAAAVVVWAVDWNATFGIPHGACIPISVFTSAYLNKAGVDARVVEAGARITDPLSRRYAVMDTNTDEDPLNASDEKGLEFLGHAVVQVPTHRIVLDLSLPTQNSKVIEGLGMVDVLVGVVDHTKNHVGFRTQFGRGEAIYRIYPKRDGWKNRNWPYQEIREAASRAYNSEMEFSGLDSTDFEVKMR